MLSAAVTGHRCGVRGLTHSKPTGPRAASNGVTMPTPAETPPTTPSATVAALRRSAGENAAGWGAQMRSAEGELALLGAMAEAQAGHCSALEPVARQLGTLGLTARALALRLAQQQWLAQGAENLAAELTQAAADAARSSRPAARAAEALVVTVEGAFARLQNGDVGSALTHEAREAAGACLQAARSLAELDRLAHDAAQAAAQLGSRTAAEAARQAHAQAEQLASGVDSAAGLAGEQCRASQNALFGLQRQHAERDTDRHRAEAEQAGWLALLGSLPSTSAATADAWQSDAAAARAAEIEARAAHARRQEACRTAQAHQADALALQQALHAPLLTARALAPAMQAVVQAAREAEPRAGDLPKRCAASLVLACRVDGELQAIGRALQALAATRVRAQDHGGPVRPDLEAALDSAAQQHRAAMAEMATALPLLATAQRCAGRAAAAAVALAAPGRAETGASAAAEVQADLLAQLVSLTQAQDRALQTLGPAVEAAVTAEADARAALVRAQGQASAAAAAEAAAQQA